MELIAYRNILERAGYCVQAARDGLEAMRLLHHLVPDLVLLDLMLPKFNGVELLRFLRSNSRLRNVPVIIYSTNSIIEAQDEPLLEGANKRLLKCQCTPAILLQAVHEVLATQKAENPAHDAPDHASASHILETATGR